MLAHTVEHNDCVGNGAGEPDEGTTSHSTPVDGFRLAYDDAGSGEPVVLLHGWPGHRGDYARVVPLLTGHARLIVPDLRGFGESDRHAVEPAVGYSAAAQVRSILGLLDELRIERAVFAGYDVGSGVIQAVIRHAPHRVRAAAVTPPVPGAGSRLLRPETQAEFWYQSLHRLPLADSLLDAHPENVRIYLRHIWSHWSGQDFPLSAEDFDRLAGLYSRPGAFTASIGWYRAQRPMGVVAEHAPATAGRTTVPFEVLWPGRDALFPFEWSDHLDDWFTNAHLVVEPDSGHFVPLQAPQAFADAVMRALAAATRVKPV